jgi:uncharacterized membrane protein
MQQQQPKSAFGMDANVAAGLAYLPVCLVHLIFSIAILATDKTNKLTRFHAVQSLLITGSIIVGYIARFICVALVMVVAAAANAPALMFVSFLIYIVFIVFALAMFVGLIISMINAFQGKIFRLPIIGGLADKWSN